MKRARPARLGLVLLLVSAAASAQTIRGAGVHRCADFVALDRLANPTPEQIAKNLQRFQWVLGFVSAYHHYQRRDLKDDTRANGVFGDTPGLLVDWLPRYCAAYPQDDLYYAAQAFIREQEARR